MDLELQVKNILMVVEMAEALNGRAVELLAALKKLEVAATPANCAKGGEAPPKPCGGCGLCVTCTQLNKGDVKCPHR